MSNNPFEDLIWDNGAPECECLVNFVKTLDEETVKNVIYGGPMQNGNKYALDITKLNTLGDYWKLSLKDPAYFDYCMAKHNFAENQTFKLTEYIHKNYATHLPKYSKRARVNAIEDVVNYVCHAYVESKVKGK